MGQSTPEVLQLIEKRHDIAFALGPCGESLAQIPWLFVGSTVTLTAEGGEELTPLDGETWISLDWSLPLSPFAHNILFERIKADFETATGLVELKSKKRYRAKEPELMVTRNVIALYGQIKDHCGTKIACDTIESNLRSGNLADDDFAEILRLQPRNFGVSMLPSFKQKMVMEMQEKEASICLEVETSRLEVRNAKWTFFQAALKRDQMQLSTVAAAPAKLAAMQHRLEMRWREEQAASRERAIKAYMEKWLRVQSVEKVERMSKHVADYMRYIAAWTCDIQVV